jgi:hypothetical protein
MLCGLMPVPMALETKARRLPRPGIAAYQIAALGAQFVLVNASAATAPGLPTCHANARRPPPMPS